MNLPLLILFWQFLKNTGLNGDDIPGTGLVSPCDFLKLRKFGFPYGRTTLLPPCYAAGSNEAVPRSIKCGTIVGQMT